MYTSTYIYVYIYARLYIRVRIWKQKWLPKKSEHIEENSPPQAKKSLGFVTCFSEFGKGIYRTYDCNFFNFALAFVVVVFQGQFMSVLHFASNN